jgi:NlpC/P60 family putative phage cell wall peptidase
MTSSEKIIGIAREWIGTPYHHQEDKKQIGCDCLGLIRGIWRDLYGTDNPEIVPNYSPTWGDHCQHDPLFDVSNKYFIKKKHMRMGDLLLFRLRYDMAVKHCSIYTGEGTMIHAYSCHEVCEEEYSTWWSKRLAGIFSFEGVN